MSLLPNTNPCAMSDIYFRLLSLDESGKYYQYFDEHLCNIDPFCDSYSLVIEQSKESDYVSAFLTYFNEEITKTLKEKKMGN